LAGEGKFVNENAVAAANVLADATDSDMFLYNSGISRPFDDEIIAECCTRRRRTNLTLLLTTEGGDPDAAYRIARCFQDHYKKFTCIVAGYCKSAGSLILTGSSDLIISDAGEIGPLDVQMIKKDELGERESGLLILSAFEALRRSAFSTFEDFFMTLKRRGRPSITFKTAAEYAATLTTGLFAPIYEQIDPMRVAESSRSQAIGLQYGMRLSAVGGNISPDGLDRLISAYPTHGFVIDRAEAEELFNEVRKPSAEEAHLISELGKFATEPFSDLDSVRQFLSKEREEQ
jgi:hypothetical protein